MPMYEYGCNGCGNVFTMMRRMGAGTEGLSCPGCGSGDLKKLLSATFTPDSEKAMPSGMESAGAKMPGMGGGCGGGMCGSGMCGI